jgi:hypothetical protein
LPHIHCGNGCVDTKSDIGNCGACGKVCPGIANGTATCSSSGCGTACNAGYALCKGVCVQTATDSANCGGCGIACHGKKTCVAGSCH